MDTPLDPSATSSDVETILSRAARTLGSIESPDYRRVKLNAHRYARLVAQLSTNFWIRDTSDVNEDVSSVLLLRRDHAGSAEYLLYISNVAEYAFVMKLDEAGSCSNSATNLLVELLKKSGLEFLSKDILSTPVNATLFNSDRPRLFNVLFSDTEYLPWEDVDCNRGGDPANDF